MVFVEKYRIFEEIMSFSLIFLIFYKIIRGFCLVFIGFVLFLRFDPATFQISGGVFQKVGGVRGV